MRRYFLFALIAMSLSATGNACDASHVKEVTAALYKIVQRSTGIPTSKEIGRLRPLVSKRLADELLAARQAEDRWLGSERAAGRAAWAAEGALFSSENEGFTSFEIKHYENRTMRQLVHFRLQFSAKDKGIDWQDQVVFASEAGRCVITDIVFNSGGNLHAKLAQLTAEVR